MRTPIKRCVHWIKMWICFLLYSYMDGYFQPNFNSINKTRTNVCLWICCDCLHIHLSTKWIKKNKINKQSPERHMIHDKLNLWIWRYRTHSHTHTKFIMNQIKNSNSFRFHIKDAFFFVVSYLLFSSREETTKAKHTYTTVMTFENSWELLFLFFFSSSSVVHRSILNRNSMLHEDSHRNTHTISFWLVR